jgi:phosphoadenosine phosphosulfate reductase
MIYEYQTTFNLPRHPLETEGYISVGCEPCTSKYISSERGGRWQGLKKEECGLHTDLINKK